MKFISVRDFRLGPGQIWKNLAKDRELIVTSNGHPIGLLVDVNEDNVELSINAYRQARAVLALDRLQAESVEKGTDRIPRDEIEKEIKAVRKSKK